MKFGKDLPGTIKAIYDKIGKVQSVEYTDIP
jgi:hypothetical protein